MNANTQTEVTNTLLPHRMTEIEISNGDVVWYKRKRYYVTLLIFFGYLMALTLRLNLSIALVQLTSKNAVDGTEPEYKWNSVEKGIILSSFSVGMTFSFLGGIIAGRFGGTRIFGLGILATSTLTILTPVLIRHNAVLFILTRMGEGLAESFSCATISEMYLYWSPPHERCRLTAIAYAGCYAAPLLAYPLCGFTARFYGWEAIFYVTGGISVLWFIIWWIFVSRTPATDRFITESERRFIIQQVNVPLRKKLKYPWKKMLRSASLWAYLNERFVQAWSFSFATYCLPLYVKDMQNVEIDSVGYISCLPHFCAVSGLILSALIADYLRSKEIWSVSRIHKTFIGCAQLSSIILIISIVILTDFTAIIICICLFRMIYSFAESCYFVLPHDMGLQYSSLICGLALSTISIGYILNPIIIGLFVTNHTAAEWSRYFMFLGCFNVWGAVIFSIFGSGKLQPWAVPEEEDEAQKKNLDEDGIKRN